MYYFDSINILPLREWRTRIVNHSTKQNHAIEKIKQAELLHFPIPHVPVTKASIFVVIRVLIRFAPLVMDNTD